MTDSCSKIVLQEKERILSPVDLDRLGNLIRKAPSLAKALFITPDLHKFLSYRKEIDRELQNKFNHCDSLHQLIRSGLYSQYSLFYLEGENPFVSVDDFRTLLKNRMQSCFIVLPIPNCKIEFKASFPKALNDANRDLHIENCVDNFILEDRSKKSHTHLTRNERIASKMLQPEEIKLSQEIQDKLRNRLHVEPEKILEDAISKIRPNS